MRRATLRQMQVFDAVARHLSFSRAAQELNLTQPAVSLQIKQLEGITKLPLFEQIGRQIFLTGAGDTLLIHIRAVLEDIKQADLSMAALRGESAGRLSIGVVSTAKYYAPSILSSFTSGYPEIDLNLKVANRAQILALLADNEIDAALMGRPPESIDVEATIFAKHPSVFIAAPDHPLTKGHHKLKDLSGEVFIVREQGSGTRILMESLMQKGHIVPSQIIEMANNETIKQAVMANMGISFISKHTVGLEVSVKKLAILDVDGTPVQRDWHVVHRRGKRLLPVVEAFITYLKGYGAMMVADATMSDPEETQITNK